MERTARYTAISAGVVALILYGSLYPFDFHRGIGPADALRVLASNWQTWDPLDDAILNILLYAPLGLFGVPALSRLGREARVAAATLAGFALSAGVELAQFYDHGRVAG